MSLASLRPTLLALALLCPTLARAVDGYEKLKFGMTAAQVQALKPCNGEAAAEPNPGRLTCQPFRWNGSDKVANFLFDHDKLIRIQIAVDVGPGPDSEPLSTVLTQKYGPPSFIATPKQLDDFLTGQTKRMFLKTWDDNTVQLILVRVAPGVSALLLQYQRPKPGARGKPPDPADL